MSNTVLPFDVVLDYGATAAGVQSPVAKETVKFAIVGPRVCTTLTLSHTGSGGNPVASPTNSTDCANGQYVAGETIQLTAAPAAGSQVSSWSGTANDSSTAMTNTVIMPASAHTASVTYVQSSSGGSSLYLPSINGGGAKAAQAAALSPAANGEDQTVGSASVQSTDAVNGSWGPWTYYWAGSHSDQRLYSQMSAHTYTNNSGCYSGCGATAWAMLFGWADYQAAHGNAYWSPRWGLYRQNGGKGANAVAPASMDSGVRNMTWEIRQDIDTFCVGSSGATAPWDMDEATGYFSGRTGTQLDTHYNVLGIHEGRLREYARNSIRDRHTPAVIGTGWLTHYPLAYGYAWQSRTTTTCILFICWDSTDYNRWFYVNEGWGGSDNGWVSAGTWFAGEIRP